MSEEQTGTMRRIGVIVGWASSLGLLGTLVALVWQAGARFERVNPDVIKSRVDANAQSAQIALDVGRQHGAEFNELRDEMNRLRGRMDSLPNETVQKFLASPDRFTREDFQREDRRYTEKSEAAKDQLALLWKEIDRISARLDRACGEMR